MTSPTRVAPESQSPLGEVNSEHIMGHHAHRDGEGHDVAEENTPRALSTVAIFSLLMIIRGV